MGSSLKSSGATMAKIVPRTECKNIFIVAFLNQILRKGHSTKFHAKAHSRFLIFPEKPSSGLGRVVHHQNLPLSSDFTYSNFTSQMLHI